MISGRSFFISLPQKTMTFEEAISKRKQIKDYNIGIPIKGKDITFLFIVPTNWDRMCDHMNMQNQKGHEIARIKFANESFSVYGVSENELSDGTPRWDMLNLGRWEEEILN